jgi:hypothetical protein
MPTQKRKRPAKKSAIVFKDLAKLSTKIKPGWHFCFSENYMIFSPYGKDAPVDCIGVDVGTKHLGIVGVSKVENRTLPVCT